VVRIHASANPETSPVAQRRQRTDRPLDGSKIVKAKAFEMVRRKLSSGTCAGDAAPRLAGPKPQRVGFLEKPLVRQRGSLFGKHPIARPNLPAHDQLGKGTPPKIESSNLEISTYETQSTP
jgi:hypothetical protein